MCLAFFVVTISRDGDVHYPVTGNYRSATPRVGNSAGRGNFFTSRTPYIHASIYSWKAHDYEQQGSRQTAQREKDR